LSHALRKHIEAITPLKDEEFELVLSYFKSKKLRKHQLLIEEGQPVLNDHWVMSGLLKAYCSDVDGKDYILQFAMQDWWVSDYHAFTTGSPATINVSCLEDSEVLYISYNDRETLCARLHVMANFFRIKSNKGYVSLQQRILSLMRNSAEERYQQLITQYPQLIQRVPKTLIAAYLGVSRETLSRLK
jgi:CRP-like cAMP-binding protein